uniref:WW domain binding protein VOPP1 n=1 Tax=Salmo trutta TaxID=8032 RepID=A0A673WXI9_SALTR
MTHSTLFLHVIRRNVFRQGCFVSHFRCRSYEDCCGTRCCVRALSIQRLWYFWLMLMMGVLFCCGAGFFIRRRMYPLPLSVEPAFNVSFTRQPVSTPVYIISIQNGVPPPDYRSSGPYPSIPGSYRDGESGTEPNKQRAHP